MAPQKKAARAAPAAETEAAGEVVGVVTHYYGGIGVAIVKFKKAVKQGATLTFRGHTTNFTQAAHSLQYDHKEIAVAPKGKEVGIKVDERVREGDEVYLV